MTVQKVQDQKQIKGQPQNLLSSDTTQVSTPHKELEPQRAQEAQLLSEIKEKSTESDREAETKVREALGAHEDARLKEPLVDLPSDVVDLGVKSPEVEASQVLISGSTIDLPISEDQFKHGEKNKFWGKESTGETVVGVPALAGLALFIGKIIKMAHKHVKKVIFRKEASDAD